MQPSNKIVMDRLMIVEGKYDKIKLSSLVEGAILQTDGFRIFKDKEKREQIRMLGAKKGILILTDSDVAGMRIRGYIENIAKNCDIKHLYIPQILGKERRKNTPSKEGTLGVEGIDATVLRALLERYKLIGGAKPPTTALITRQMLFADRYIGATDSSRRRLLLLRHLTLPNTTGTNALLRVINDLMTLAEYERFTQQTNELASKQLNDEHD